MKQHPTLWTHRESKFKPRNKQAALICIKAKEIHMPPPEPVQYTPRRPSKEEILKEIEVKLAEIQKEKEIEAERQRQIKLQQRVSAKQSKQDKKNAPPKQTWLKKWLLKAEKNKGKLAPSPEAIAAIKKMHLKSKPPR
jgi:hypothetical protein